MKRIVHIAPTLPPAINGLGDFCSILARNLEREGYTDHIFLVRHKTINFNDTRVIAFEPNNFQERLFEQKPDVIMLHYVGYAYEKRGMPFYIARGLKRYKMKTRCRLLVFFHELYSSSNSLLKLPFYTQRFQKIIVRELYRIADAAFTNCSAYQDLLRRVLDSHGIETICTGIFSNVPDDLYDGNIRRELHSLVVFGSNTKRRAVYGNSLFKGLLDQLEIDTIYDIGPGECKFDHRGLTIHQTGVLTPPELAAYLNRTQYGALSYAPNLLGKSGIFSAYAAFGVIPVNLPLIEKPVEDGLVEGKNYFTCRSPVLQKRLDHFVAREEMLKWYRTHDQYTVARAVKQQL